MRRLFAFGCSFTAYEWPTWADILSRQFDYFENWGRAGAGNQFICNSVAEADARHNFNHNDTIIIMWSSMMREDRYRSDGWLTPGNFLGAGKEFYNEEFYNNFICAKGCYIRDLASMHLVHELLKFKKCKYHFLSMIDINFPSDMYSKYFLEKLKLQKELLEIVGPLKIYNKVLSEIKPSVHKVIFNYDWQSRKLYMAKSSKTGEPHRIDSHPLPIEHLEYIQKVLPEYKINEETIKWTQQITDEICNFEFYKNKSWNPLMNLPKERL